MARQRLDFYTKVIGWSAADAGMPNMRYTSLKVGERLVARRHRLA